MSQSLAPIDGKLPSTDVAPAQLQARPPVAIPAEAAETQSYRQIQRTIAVGVLTSVLLFAGIGTLAATTDIAGAVVGSGHVVVDNSVKRIQHLTGGIVSAIYARDGDQVKAGDLLVKLDETTLRAELDIARRTYFQALARASRLAAERDDLAEIKFPSELLDERTDTSVAETVAGERRLFEARATNRDVQIRQIREQIVQLQEQIRGVQEQITSTENQIALSAKELEGLRSLYKKKMVSIGRLNELERDQAELIGLRGKLSTDVAAYRARVAEAEVQIAVVNQEFRTKASEELRAAQDEANLAASRIIQGVDALRRVEVVSPVDGVVHESTVHTIGGIVTPNVDLMQIVPTNDKLVVEARVSPGDIDQIYPGQPARIRFSAFDRNTTPELNASVDVVAADLTLDERTRQSYYKVRLRIEPAEAEKLGDIKLVPGMPAESFIRTADRTIFSYLLKPITDQMNRAFREG